MTVQTQTSHHYQTDGFRSPVDNEVYDLLQTLTSKCEAIEARSTRTTPPARSSRPSRRWRPMTSAMPSGQLLKAQPNKS